MSIYIIVSIIGITIHIQVSPSKWVEVKSRVNKKSANIVLNLPALVIRPYMALKIIAMEPVMSLNSGPHFVEIFFLVCD